MLIGDDNLKHEVHLNGRDYLMKHRVPGLYRCGIHINGYPEGTSANNR